MKIWLDAHLSPALAGWLEANYAIEATALRELGLRDATDWSIFQPARQADVVVMTKDRDFVDLVSRLGTPPQVGLVDFWQHFQPASATNPKRDVTAHFFTGKRRTDD
jgi:predicted nuclease of predicted toxin-antitoxin system